MNLSAEVKQKNEKVSQKRIALQKQLQERILMPHFRSFFITFVLVPLLIGVAVGAVRYPGSFFSYRLSRFVLMGWRFLPALKFQKSELHR